MAASTSAQNAMTSSPYSMFGLGEMASGLYGQNTSMAGVTVGMREGMLMNIENPAGLTALDSCKLFAEASAFVSDTAQTGALATHSPEISPLSHWEGVSCDGGICPPG